MAKITKDTHVVCPELNERFFGTIQELKEYIEDIDEWENYRLVTVQIAHKEPFMNVDNNWLIDLIDREMEHQGCTNERSSESGDEMVEVSKLILDNTKVDYEAIMAKMPQLYYPESKEIQIDLKDF